MAKHDRNFIFTVSAGRSGTAYLAKLLAANLPNAEIHHERTGYHSFGVDTPDASHFTLFNSAGNVKKVQDFWAQKFDRIGHTSKEFYGEASHFNAKAGMLENLHRLEEAGHTHIIFLDRDPFKTLWSYHNRFDFANVGFTWLFSLDPGYPNKIVPSQDYLKYGQAGIALWYIHEMLARGEYYRCLLADNPHVTLHHYDLAELVTTDGASKLKSSLIGEALSKPATIPPKENASTSWFFGKEEETKLQKIMTLFDGDMAALGRAFFDSGKRLATPAQAARSKTVRTLKITAGKLDTQAKPLNKTPVGNTQVVKDAIQLLQKNQYVQAQALLEQALQSDPDNTEALHQLGLIHARRGNLEQGAALLHAALTLAPDDPGLLYGLSFILLRLENFQDAADVLADIIATNIEDAGVWRNYGTALGFLKNFEKCFPALEHARDLEPDHPLAYNTLSRFYEESGDTKNARKFAMRGLLLKDRLANQDFERLQHAHKLDLQGKGSTGTKSVIAVSLWGSHPTFNRGAIEYTEQAKDIFPDWVCRFYHDETVPARTLDKLGQLGAECIAVTTKQKQVHGAFWRFFASDDPEVAWFQCRDADCRPSERERAAVEAWQKSGQNFHIMRDHMWHSDLILAGLWGGRAGILPNMELLTYALYGEQGDRYDDQLFLARAIWPLIKGHSVTHDSTFDVFPAEPFPTGNARTEEEHVGYSFRYTERKRTMKLNLNTKTLEVNTVSDTNS